MSEDPSSGQGDFDAGLDLHEWETRWSEIEPMLRESPVETLPDATDLISQMLAESGRPADAPLYEPDEEAAMRYAEARSVADRLSAGEEVDVFEIGRAAEALRELHDAVISERGGGLSG
jgi:hypothetical protein